MADSVWRPVGEQFAAVNVVDRVAYGGGGVMVWAGLWYGQAYVMEIDGILNAQRYRDEILSPIVVPFTGHVTHWSCLGCSGLAYSTVCSSSCHYPATSHSHWRGVDQHSTGHKPQPDQLYAKEMCCTAWGKWWSHQILTSFRTPPPPPPNIVKLHILKWPIYCGKPKAHLCNNHAV